MSSDRFVGLTQQQQKDLSLRFAYECAGVKEPAQEVDPI